MVGSVGPMPTVFYPTVPRPWVASPYDAEFRRDPVTGTPYVWNVTSGRWEPAGPNDIPFTLYVNGVTGNDAAAGDAANPVRTIQEAVRRLPKRVLHNAVVDIADNGGAVLLYDEQLLVEDIVTEGIATLRFVGKNVARIALAASPANAGTYRTWTINPSPGWVPNSLVGMFVLFTAGPHTGLTAWILGNTANTLTLGYYPWPWEGAYGPADAGEIREVTTQIQQQSLPWTPPTLTIKNLSSPNMSRGRKIEFYSLHILSDLNYRSAIESSGRNFVRFNRCRIDDYFSLDYGSSGFLDFQECMAWTCRTAVRGRWFSNYPGTDTSVIFVSGGIIGGFVLNSANGLNFQAVGTNVVTDPITPTNSPTNLFLVGGRYVVFANGSIDGGAIRTPILLNEGAFGLLTIWSMEIFRSNTSAIRFYDQALPGMSLHLDEFYDPVWQPLSNLHDNAQYGIDVAATGRVVFFGPTVGAANGIGGMRLRDGGFASFIGTVGTEPQLAGPAPGTAIDFDDRSPTLWLPFTTDQTGLETLARYAYRGT